MRAQFLPLPIVPLFIFFSAIAKRNRLCPQTILTIKDCFWEPWRNWLCCCSSLPQTTKCFVFQNISRYLLFFPMQIKRIPFLCDFTCIFEKNFHCIHVHEIVLLCLVYFLNISHQSVKNTVLGDIPFIFFYFFIFGDIPFNSNFIALWPQRLADKVFVVCFPLVAALAKADVMFHLRLNPA